MSDKFKLVILLIAAILIVGCGATEQGISGIDRNSDKSYTALPQDNVSGGITPTENNEVTIPEEVVPTIDPVTEIIPIIEPIADVPTSSEQIATVDPVVVVPPTNNGNGNGNGNKKPPKIK